MSKRAFAYLRVSTLQQVDGNSLEGQLKEIERYCNAFDIELVDTYSDEGKSGKTIAGRDKFLQMLDEVSKRHDIDYVIVWKLSRFGRNVCDSLNALYTLQEHGVNLIAVQENLKTDGVMGKFIFTIFSAMAEMERENILEQTGNGKRYNALDGNWNGGQAPYGYKLVEKKLVINPEEADTVKKIFNWYMESEESGYSTVTAKLNEAGIKPRQLPRLDRKKMQEIGSDEDIFLEGAEEWYTGLVKKIIDNPVYCGKLRYGYSKVKNLENGKQSREYNANPIFVDGKHEAIIPEELWKMAQEKRKRVKIAHGRHDSNKEDIHNIFNSIAKCPQCGGNMVSIRAGYTKVNGEHVTYYNYICGYYNNHKKGKCKKNPIKAAYLDKAVMKAITDYVNRPNIISEIEKRLGKEMDTSKLEKEILDLQDELDNLDRAEKLQYDLLGQIGIGGKFKNIKPEKISENIDKIVVEREELSGQLENKKLQLEAAKLDMMDFEMIKSLLVNFNEALQIAPKELKKKLIKSLVKEVKLGYDDKGKVIPISMTLNFTGEQIELMHNHNEIFELNVNSVETLVLLTQKRKSKDYKVEIEVPIEAEDSAEEKATYGNIKRYISEKYGVNVHTRDIAEVKRSCGLEMRLNYNKSKKNMVYESHLTDEKREYIIEALNFYALI